MSKFGQAQIQIPPLKIKKCQKERKGGDLRIPFLLFCPSLFLSFLIFKQKKNLH